MTAIMFAPLLQAGTIVASPESIPESSIKMTLSKRYPSPNRFLSHSDILGDLMTIRGGQSQDPYQQQHPYPATSDVGSTANSSYQTYENGFENYNPPSPYDSDREANILQESVQDRHDKWRSEQMERYANLTPEQEYNPRDEQGRMKLLSSVSKGSRAFIFFFLMWRDIYLFEVADLSMKGSLRKMITRGFLTTVFLGNLAGVVTSVTSQGHSAKNRLKAILNLDKLVETALLLWNLGRITLFPSKFVPREIFVAGTLHSVFFLIQCQAFTRVTWDERVAPVLQTKQQQERNNQQAFSQSSREYQTTTLGDVESPKTNSAMYSSDPYQNPPTRSTPYS
eukprot:CAMPEP_0201128980 /NCGR_PEP_ID=MMETSP0850-20130426/35392_1 /ASSEMBLY_ACC=CAM_ASM_000622 /TAXON_ID=183588 /ORGANISM="Pseudo-nitzschia fraudulenta, Strain WWA7" /LENGTH=337 /DNA_ID=CAMNT_0047398329 /DNA_START=138 /DNA_END=1151 /DNA_ORIENTATION=+